VTLRFGYPATVFNDKRRLGDANAMNTFLALEWALENGYGCYDMGSCVRGLFSNVKTPPQIETVGTA
jgi:hypothetical protein